MKHNDAFELIVAQAPSVTWSVSVRKNGQEIVGLNSQISLPTASVGKVFLLIAAARALSTGTHSATDRLTLIGEDRVGDSGIWQYLSEPSMSFESACVLVASVSDNCAANVLLRELGLNAVHLESTSRDMPETLMCDQIRDIRLPSDPPAPSMSRTCDLTLLMAEIAHIRKTNDYLAIVETWLSLNTDLSMVASAFSLDPLAHSGVINGMSFFNKTGTDIGVRADAGNFVIDGTSWSYAVTAHWPDGDSTQIGSVLHAMRECGKALWQLAQARN